jgi:hypothetical protein
VVDRVTDFDPRDALARAIMRAGPCDYVVFPEDDPGHVNVRKKGSTEVLRFRLSPEALQYLAGEFPELPAGGLTGALLVPSESKEDR